MGVLKQILTGGDVDPDDDHGHGRRERRRGALLRHQRGLRREPARHPGILSGYP